MKRLKVLSKEEREIEYPTIMQTFRLAIFASLFMLATFSNPLITIVGEITLYGLAFIYVALFLNAPRWIRSLVLVAIASVGMFLIVSPINPIYLGLEKNAIVTYMGQGIPLTFYDYGFFMFLLFIESIIAFGITIWYYRRKGKSATEGEAEDQLEPIFKHFLTDITPRKLLILAAMLSLAAFYEEMIYRYFLMNILLAVGIPLIIVFIICGVIFSLAHRGNGYMAYVFSSLFSGIVFCIVFYNSGIGASWLVHLTWNAIVVLEDYFTIWATSKNATLKRGGTGGRG
jgi:membrane protease YdiL (CAAX protease family)